MNKLIPTFLLAIVLTVSSDSLAQPMVGVMPLCSTTSFTYDEVNNAVFAPTPYLTGNVLAANKENVGIGLKHDCASQIRPTFELVCSSPGNCTTQFKEFVTVSAATAFPNNINANGGDGQQVVISIPSIDQRGWAGCFPGSDGATGSKCPQSLANTFSGTMFFRAKDHLTGNFSGAWTVSNSSTNPGFRIQRKSESCPVSSPSCTYEVIFERTAGGLTVKTDDYQVILQFYVRGVTDNFMNYIAIPMIVYQEDIANPVPTATPTPVPTNSCSLAVSKDKKKVTYTFKPLAGISKNNVAVTFSAKTPKKKSFTAFARNVKTDKNGKATSSVSSTNVAKGVKLKGTSQYCTAEIQR